MKSFPRFWRNHPYLRNKWYLIWPCCLCSLRQSKRVFFEKKNQNDQFKKPHFLPPPIPNIFSWKFLYLIGLIDTKGIGVDSLCRTASLLRIGGAGKLGFFESAILIFFFFQIHRFFLLHLNESKQPVHMSYHLFLHYGWFLQTLVKVFIRANMHTTVVG